MSTINIHYIKIAMAQTPFNTIKIHKFLHLQKSISLVKFLGGTVRVLVRNKEKKKKVTRPLRYVHVAIKYMQANCFNGRRHLRIDTVQEFGTHRAPAITGINDESHHIN